MQKELLKKLAATAYTTRLLSLQLSQYTSASYEIPNEKYAPAWEDLVPWLQVEQIYEEEVQAILKKLCEELLPPMMRFSSIIFNLPDTEEYEVVKGYMNAMIIILKEALLDEEEIYA